MFFYLVSDKGDDDESEGGFPSETFGEEDFEAQLGCTAAQVGQLLYLGAQAPLKRDSFKSTRTEKQLGGSNLGQDNRNQEMSFAS